MVIVTDLEGVLIPEVWEEVARVTGVSELAMTTHDEPDFGRLMDRRVELLSQHDLRLPELSRIAGDVLPYPGATELLAWYRTKAQVMIVSDTFHEFSEQIVQRMGPYNLFANTFRADEEGRVLGYRLRIRGRKDNVIRSLKQIGFRIVAIGDGYNDELMFRMADHPVLFNAPDDLAARIENGTRVTTYEEIRRLIIEVHKLPPLALQSTPAEG
ncbi:MAG: phosphoserine phosphatase [Gemmatimonadota bacterium]|nr:MAG: phosphoserine phosphatase [Gemmatimonadota bacterium]